MTLFCDTSALIKLLIEEPDSERMLRAAAAAEWIAFCCITWAEATAAMARRARRGHAMATRLSIDDRSDQNPAPVQGAAEGEGC